MNNYIPTPKELLLSSGNISHQWKLFKQTWKNYETAIGLTDKPDTQRVATLLAVIGNEALELYNTFEWDSESDSTKIEVVLSKFEAYCNPKRNITYERFQFMNRKQREGENFNCYLIELKKLAATCEYGTMKDSIIKDMIVLGVRNNKLRENLLKDTDLTLQKATDIANAAEKAQEQASSMSTNKEDVFKISDKGRSNKKPNKSTKLPRDCKFCGGRHIWGRNNCPAYDKDCHVCKKKNHYAKHCPENNSTPVNIIEDEEEQNEEDEDFYIC